MECYLRSNAAYIGSVGGIGSVVGFVELRRSTIALEASATSNIPLESSALLHKRAVT